MNNYKSISLSVYRKATALLTILFLPAIAWCQEVDENEPVIDFSLTTFEWSIIIASVIVGVAAIVAVYKVTELMVRMREVEIYEKHGLEQFLAEKEANDVSWLQRVIRRMNNAVPVSREEEILMDHSYDGIKELDNNLPPWWLWGFYISIIFSVIYIAVHHFSPLGKSSEERYEMQMEKAQQEVDAYLAQQADLVDETNVTLLVDAPSLETGKEVFITQCAACHLEHGGGSDISVGPNLTDEYWIHGGGIKNIFSTIKYGVPEKGMIAWKTQLPPSDIHAVASYIVSLQGSNPPMAKEPQGEMYIPEEIVENIKASEEDAEENGNTDGGEEQ